MTDYVTEGEEGQTEIFIYSKKTDVTGLFTIIIGYRDTGE